MGKTSKSPKQILRTAYEVGERALPKYSHRFSPRTYSQPQLFACLILKAFFQTDYRGIEGILSDLPELCSEIGMKEPPHFTTLQKAERRFLNASTTRELLQETIKTALTNQQMKRIVELAAIDGSGFESRHVSDYFLKRRGNPDTKMHVTRYPKANLLCDCASHMTLALSVRRGPCPDIKDFFRTVKSAVDAIPIKMLLGDAGYDSERSHVFANEELGIGTIIPPRNGRSTTRLPTTHWRRLMRTNFDKANYGQRWQVETLFSMIKRVLGSALRARQFHSQCREIRLKALAMNIMLLAAVFLFLVL